MNEFRRNINELQIGKFLDKYYKSGGQTFMTDYIEGILSTLGHSTPPHFSYLTYLSFLPKFFST